MKDIDNPQLNQFHNNKSKNNQLRLNDELLRMKVHQHIKYTQQCWKLKEKQLCEFFNHYIPLSRSSINIKSLFNSKNTRLIKAENKIYFGTVINRKKEGKGILIYKQGRIFHGQFLDNQKNGFGCQIYSNGNLYIGHFHQNKKHGDGQFYWFNLTENNNDKFQTQNIEKYIGAWWGGLPDGLGVHFKVNGDLYEGKFKNGLKHGQGIQKFHNGDQYRGQYVNGFPEGYGQYRWTNGSQYKGDFKQSFRNGYGIWKKKKNSKQYYKGHYLLNQKHGHGIYAWENGYVYKGNFQNDKRNGQGQLYFNEELIYKGNWQNGQTEEKFNPDTIQKKRKIISAPKNKIQNTIKKSQKKINVHAVSQNFRKTSKNYHLKRQFSAGYKSRKNQTNTFYVTFKHTDEQSCCGHKSGHKNCIPQVQIGKMPKPEWKNPRLNWKGPLTPKKLKRCHY